MNKIKFDLKYKEDIINGNAKVITRNNIPVIIIAWELPYSTNIVGVLGKSETPTMWTCDGYARSDKKPTVNDLYVVFINLNDFDLEVCTISNLCFNLAQVNEIKAASQKLIDIAKKHFTQEIIDVMEASTLDDAMKRAAKDIIKEAESNFGLNGWSIE